MKVQTYLALKDRIRTAGFADEVGWAETVGPPDNAWGFFCEYAWVVINSGMKNTVARLIWDRVRVALEGGDPVSSAFRHPGKAAAIQKIHDEREVWFRAYTLAPQKLDFLESMPWIGPITKYHLAKNFGHDCCKPDRHLVRIAEGYGLTPIVMCQALADATGDRIGTVDLVIWRAAAEGMI